MREPNLFQRFAERRKRASAYPAMVTPQHIDYEPPAEELIAETENDPSFLAEEAPADHPVSTEKEVDWDAFFEAPPEVGPRK